MLVSVIFCLDSDCVHRLFSSTQWMFAVVSELLPIEFFFHSCMSSLITREKGISVEKNVVKFQKIMKLMDIYKEETFLFLFPIKQLNVRSWVKFFFYLSISWVKFKAIDSKLKLLARACFRLFNAGRK